MKCQAGSALNHLCAPKSLPYFHAWKVRQGWNSYARPGRMWDAGEGAVPEEAPTCGDERI